MRLPRMAALAWLLFSGQALGRELLVDPSAWTLFNWHVFNTIQDAADNARPGDTVTIRGGVYRETVTMSRCGRPGMPIRFQAKAGERVTISGSDPVTECQAEHKLGGDVYSFPWDRVFIDSPHECYPEGFRNFICGRAEQFFINGKLQRQVLQTSQLAPGTFCVDRPHSKIVFRLMAGGSPKDSSLEVSTRQLLWQNDGVWVELDGLNFLHAANQGQHASVMIFGDHCSLVNCSFQQTNASGAWFGGYQDSATGCVFRDNGQLGFGTGRAHGLTITGCLIEHNNTKGFSRGWEAGGCKVVLSRGVVISQCMVRNNFGPGLWFDIGNEDCTVKNCLISGNFDAGIFYEISYGLHATDNVIVANGFDYDGGAWGVRAGITVSSSPGCTIERNILTGNCEGLDFREQTRTTPSIDVSRGSPEQPVSNHDEIVRNNLIAFNYDAELWGWFDLSDQRYLPFSMRRPPGAGTKDKQLSDLHMQMDHNVFASTRKGPFYHWGAAWQNSYAWSDLALLYQQTGLENGSIVADVPFKNAAQMNFSLPSDSPVFKMGAYPKGPVPGVTLGRY